MPAGSANQFPKVILEERASDGSDTSNPAADHRALFLGEDGLLHLRDSAGTVTDIGASGIPATLFDAKGDIIAASAADTAARVAVGANGAILEAASGATAGVQWARTIRGKVQGSNGAVLQGSGFTCVRNGTGDYTITITSAFAAAPIVVGTVITTASSRMFTADTITTTSIHVYISSTSALADHDFEFIAIAAN